MAPPWGATPPAFLSIPHPPTTLAGVARVSIILASRKLSATPYAPPPGRREGGVPRDMDASTGPLPEERWTLEARGRDPPCPCANP